MTLWPRALLLFSLAIGVNAGDLPAQADPIQVSGGLVSGVAAGGVQTYKGIPYAKPPVGDLRWRAPQSGVPWSGILVADHFSPICVQPDPLGGHSCRLGQRGRHISPLRFSISAWPMKLSLASLPRPLR